MKILHFNFSDKQGGAAISAMRIAKELKLQGIDNEVLVVKKITNNPLSIVTRSSLYNSVLKIRFLLESYRLRKFRPYIGNFSLNNTGIILNKLIDLDIYDAYYLHWINDAFLSIADIEFLLKTGKPVFWVLHDMWAFTGGCHCSFECSNYKLGCHLCPILSVNKKSDLPGNELIRKSRCLTKYTNLIFISPSTWMRASLSGSIFKLNSQYLIPNLYDPDVFKLLDKSFARHLFNLPENKKIILFGADLGVNNPYKGWSYLEAALNSSDFNDDFLVVVFGCEYNKDIDERLNIPIRFIGQFFDEFSLACLYNAADVYITTSLAESFGMTVMEAIACGTPSVAFSIGGLTDIVEHKTNGYLARPLDLVDLIEGIHWSINYSQDNFNRLKCTNSNHNKFSSTRVVKKHIDILHKYIGNGKF